MTILIDEIIHKCRYSRITNNSDDFNKMANMITSRKDLNFGDYYDMKRFSCTEETERKFYRRFKEEYDELFKCLAENSYSKNLGPSRYVIIKFKLASIKFRQLQMLWNLQP